MPRRKFLSGSPEQVPGLLLIFRIQRFSQTWHVKYPFFLLLLAENYTPGLPAVKIRIHPSLKLQYLSGKDGLLRQLEKKSVLVAQKQVFAIV